MITGIYSAATAMEQASLRHELIAQNLAYASMPGYRRVSLPQQTFESTLKSAQNNPPANGSSEANTRNPVVDFSSGHFERTDHPLDLAITGDGFFAIETPGETLYTRNGTFQLNGEGLLVTNDGHPVASENGTLTLPPEIVLSQLKISADGRVIANGVELGRLKLVDFADPQKLIPAGITLFQAPDDVAPQAATGSIVQGTREHSNVHPVQELVDMISASRAHEAAQRAMKTITDAIQNHTNLRGG